MKTNLIRINASSAYIVDRCPGSLDFRSKKYPLEKQSKDAKAGDEAHKKFTDELLTGKIPTTLLPYFPIEWDDLQVETEFKTVLDGFELFAKPDILVRNEKTLFVLDMKTGFSDVSEMDPLQNVLAAYLFLTAYPELKIDKVICRFIGTETGLTTYDIFTPAKIYTRIKSLLSDVVKAKKKKAADLKTGTHCKNCSHRTHCPKLKKVLTEFTNPKLRGVAVEDLPRDLIRILPVADKIIDDFRKKLKERLEDGLLGPIEGVSLKFQNAPRSWDLAVDMETLASRTGLKPETFADLKLKTVKAVLDENPGIETKISSLIVQGKQARLVVEA